MIHVFIKSLKPIPINHHHSSVLPLGNSIGLLSSPFPILPRFLIYRIIVILGTLTLVFHYFIPAHLQPNIITHFFISPNHSSSTSSSSSSSTTLVSSPTHPTSLLTLARSGWVNLPSPTHSCLTAKRQRSQTLPERQLSPTCASNWIAHGFPCHRLIPKSSLIPAQKVDILWTWVNGSLSKDPQPAYLFREHDELRYSFRSVAKSIPSQLVHNFHLFTADVPTTFFNRSEPRGNVRMGSVPTWLHLGTIGNGIHLHHHSQAFKASPNYLAHHGFTPDEPGAHRWRQSVVPSRNSLAIESQIPHLDHLGDQLLYMNDDVFLLQNFSGGDLATNLYGPVFRLQWDLLVPDRPPFQAVGSATNGEWPSLGYSNWLLSNRFGRRSRRYIHHVAKMLPVESMRELSEIWADELSQSATSAYRSQLPEVNIPFLTTWYHIEKQREAILYSFIILKSDANADGQLSSAELRTIHTTLEFELTHPDPESIVISPSRLSSHPVTLQNNLGSESQPKCTVYEWVSSDGYPLQSNGTSVYPDYSSLNPEPLCKISLSKCFANLTSPSSLFKRITYEFPECGDCIIAKLVGSSSPNGGLDAALATADAGHWFLPRWFNFAGFPEEKVTRMVGDQKSWEDVEVFDPPRRQRRLVGVRLLQRYQYVLGSTPNTFRAVTSAIGARKFLEPLELPHSKVAMVTVNDLIVEKGAEIVLGNWLRRMWPGALRFEVP